jgi:hypothetical protein
MCTIYEHAFTALGMEMPDDNDPNVSTVILEDNGGKNLFLQIYQ